MYFIIDNRYSIFLQLLMKLILILINSLIFVVHSTATRVTLFEKESHKPVVHSLKFLQSCIKMYLGFSKESVTLLFKFFVE